MRVGDAALGVPGQVVLSQVGMRQAKDSLRSEVDTPHGPRTLGVGYRRVVVESLAAEPRGWLKND